MLEIQSLIGKRFNRLVVIGVSEECDCKNTEKVLCRCDCGNVVAVRQNSLKTGNTRSCGCLQKEYQEKRKVIFDEDDKRLYHIWRGMLRRCYDPRSKSYYNYGERDIVVCDEWKNSFKLFCIWSKENGYAKNLTLDRKDNSKGYAPSNCRWVDRRTQMNNMRLNVNITIDGQTHTMTEWGRIYNISGATIWARINKYKWNEVDAVTRPLRGK